MSIVTDSRIAMSLSNSLCQCLEKFGGFVYKNFIRYFIVSEVGERWALFNNAMGFFALCIGLIYAAKPWGLTKWNKNVVKNTRRLRALAFKKLTDQFAASSERDPTRKRISELSFWELRDELQHGTITASDAVDAFRWKSLQCQEKYNCIVEFIKEAPSAALALDNQYKDENKPPLFGMPFSVKENVCLTGYDCTRGLAKDIGWLVKEDCSLVTHLRSLGAIPIVRTNIPQTMLSYMCSNPAYGTTLNPYDTTRSPGGSSGGEACLISAGGCPFGLGSDIAGSLRIPAHFCGVTALKPTSARMRATGSKPGTPGVRLGWSCGYFTRDVESQRFLIELTLVPEYFSLVPHCVPLQFNGSTSYRKLKIGYYTEDGWFPSVPACKRAVLNAKKILEAAGHELVPFEIPEPDRAMRLLLKCLFPDNGAYWLGNLKYEPLDAYLKTTKRMVSAPLWLRWIGSRLLAPFDKNGSIVIGAYNKDLAELRGTFEEVDAYVKEFMDSWRQSKLDAVIGTAFPFPAVQHEYPTKLGTACFGTGIYNLLDVPAGVVIVDKVTKADEQEMINYPTAEAAKRMLQHPIHRMVRKAMLGSEGLPIGVQVIALPYKEELCLQVMKEIEKGRGLKGTV